MEHSSIDPALHERRPRNEGRVVGAKRALKPQQVWAIRFWLDQYRMLRDRALFDLAIDSKLRGCDVVKIRIGDIAIGGRIRDRAVVVQQKTKRPVQFELVEPARKTLFAWLERRGGTLNDPEAVIQRGSKTPASGRSFMMSRRACRRALHLALPPAIHTEHDQPQCERELTDPSSVNPIGDNWRATMGISKGEYAFVNKPIPASAIPTPSSRGMNVDLKIR